MTVFDDTLTDTATLAPAVVDLLSLREAVAEDITAGGSIDDARLSLREATAEAFLLSFELIGTENVRLFETVQFAESHVPVAVFGRLMEESARIAERIRIGHVVTLSEIATIEATLAAANGWLIAEELQLTDTLTSLATYGLTIAERIRFQDILARFLGGDLAETVSLTPTVVMTARFSERTDEVATLGEALTPQLLLHVAAEETVAFDDTDILQMIYAGELRDDVAIEAMSLDPSGDVVTWAVNTRMGFVTQYKDYDFNSFAMINGKYVGANADGLWELDGDTDDGEQIIAGLTGGILQMNSSKRHGLKGVYIGLRGSGEFYLKLTAGDGTEYVYRITARDMDTTKVNIGKGLRHRYLSYSLENVGQDFELESIEFVPMRGYRRV
jgi:hypothetical protein